MDRAAAPLTILCAGGYLCAASPWAIRWRAPRARSMRSLAVMPLCPVLSPDHHTLGGGSSGSPWRGHGHNRDVPVNGAVDLQTRGRRWKQYLLCQLPGAILGASVVAVALPITILLRAAQLPALLVLPCLLIAAAVAAVVTGALLPREWFNTVTFGALDKIMEPADKLGRLLREYLHRHQLLYKIALVPFSWYETILFFMHVSSQGLWASCRAHVGSAPGERIKERLSGACRFPLMINRPS